MQLADLCVPFGPFSFKNLFTSGPGVGLGLRVSSLWRVLLLETVLQSRLLLQVPKKKVRHPYEQYLKRDPNLENHP